MREYKKNMNNEKSDMKRNTSKHKNNRIFSGVQEDGVRLPFVESEMCLRKAIL